MSGPDIDVSVPGREWAEHVPGAEDACRAAALRCLEESAGEALPLVRLEVSIVLADDTLVRDLNRTYRGQDKPTNVLSFAALDDGAPVPEMGPILLGDVVLALETILAEAKAGNKSPLSHLSHLVVHGVLHLLGFDHGNEDEAMDMESRETAILATLGIPDPHAAGEGGIGTADE